MVSNGHGNGDKQGGNRRAKIGIGGRICERGHDACGRAAGDDGEGMRWHPYRNHATRLFFYLFHPVAIVWHAASACIPCADLHNNTQAGAIAGNAGGAGYAGDVMPNRTKPAKAPAAVQPLKVTLSFAPEDTARLHALRDSLFPGLVWAALVKMATLEGLDVMEAKAKALAEAGL